MAKVTKRGDELQSKKLELLEDITSTIREIYKIKGPIKDVRTVIDVLGGKVIENSQTDNMDILVCQNGVQIVIPGYTVREQKNMHLAKGIGYIYLYSNYMANNKKYDVNDAMKMRLKTHTVFEYTGNKTEVDLVKAQEECYPVAVRKLYETIKNVTEAYGMPIIDLTTV